MSSASGSRRIGPIRKALSDYSAVIPRISSGGALDDKNVKADGNTSRTNSFIIVLLVLSLFVCSILGYSHFSKQGQSIELLNDGIQGNPQLRQQGEPSTHNDNVIKPEAQHHDMKVLQGKKMQFGDSTAANQAIGAPASKRSPAGNPPQQDKPAVGVPPITKAVQPSKAVDSPRITLKPTKIDWEGCLYELPPLKPPTSDTANTNNKPFQNNKNRAGYDYNRRHIVAPPAGEVTLVCCNTTKGPLNIEVHPTWAPRGAERFLLMVNSGFFSTEVGLFRALKDFLVQFGLAGDVALQKAFHELGNLKDDAPWLPLGPTGREINGTQRFQKGYLAYAGAGKNSRGTQLIMAFQDNLYLGGGSPWEVPFGQVFGANSFETISKIYTKYGEKPSQSKIMNRGVSYLKEEFPLLDYINKCAVTKEHVPWSYEHVYQ